MKRFACHRLYAGNGYVLQKAVVCINEAGEIQSYEPLEGETPFTQWIGGVILVNSSPSWELKGTFSDLRNELSELPTNHTSFAWHLTDFDFEKEEITPQSRLYRLL